MEWKRTTLLVKNSRPLERKRRKAVRCHCMGRFPNSPSFLLPLYWPQPLPSQTSRPSPPPSISTLTTRFLNKQSMDVLCQMAHRHAPLTIHLFFSCTLSYLGKISWSRLSPMLSYLRIELQSCVHSYNEPCC